MLRALKADFRKLLTVRSTYLISGLALFINLVIAGWGKGYRLDSAMLNDPQVLQDAMMTGVMITAVLVALVGILMVSHEYRYNTILYALTSTRRTTYLVSKFIAISIYGLVLSALIFASAALFMYLGIALAGNTLGPQSVAFGDVIWRVLFYGWGYTAIAMLIAALVRNQVGAFVTFLIVPSTIEGLLSMLLKENTSFLPFSALGAVIFDSGVMSYGQAAGLFALYMSVMGLLAWLLLLRRDAN